MLVKPYVWIFAVYAASSAYAAAPDGWTAYGAGRYREAYAQWLQAATDGDAEAQYNVGFLYDLGKGVRQSDALARFWYEKAALQGNAAAQNNLGAMYRDGEGVVKNPARAFEYFQAAAEGGDAKGQYNLGLAYAQGDGVPLDYVAAAGWLRRAAALNYPKARYSLAILFSQGKGVTQNRMIAEALLLLIAVEGSPVKELALTAQTQLQKEISPSELKAAQALAKRLADEAQFAKLLATFR